MITLPTEPTLPPVSLIREIERQHESGRDWDCEGDLNTLETECAIDRTETGCTGHDYYAYDDGHYLVWRVWSEASRESMRQGAANAAAPERGLEIQMEVIRGRIRGRVRQRTFELEDRQLIILFLTRKAGRQFRRACLRAGDGSKGTPLFAMFREHLTRKLSLAKEEAV